MTKIEDYFKNLWFALTGNNPYQVELDQVREEYGRTADRVNQLEDFYYKALEKWDESNGHIKDYQALVENLRERVAEKDATISQLREEFAGRTEGYKKRIADYSGQIARLQGELAKVRKRAAKPSKPKSAKNQEPKAETTQKQGE